MKYGCRIYAGIENEIFPVLNDNLRDTDTTGILDKYLKKNLKNNHKSLLLFVFGYAQKLVI